MAIKTAFTSFVTIADDVEAISSSFNALKALIPSLSSEANSTKPFYEHLKIAIEGEIPFGMKRLFQIIDTRWKAYSTQRAQVQASTKGNKVVVSGAGPCGLRAAVELALLGFSVSVIEKRREFSRHNILKTWMPTVEDLIALGFKNYFPSFKQHGIHAIGTAPFFIFYLTSNKSLTLAIYRPYLSLTMADTLTPPLLSLLLGILYLLPSGNLQWRFSKNRVVVSLIEGLGTREIQICLLKTSLLLGVSFHYEQATAGLVEPNVVLNESSGTWRLLTNSEGLKSLPNLNVFNASVPESPEKDFEKEPESDKVEDLPMELALKVGETNADRLDKTSKVDFLEKANSLHGAFIQKDSDVPSKIGNIILFDHVVVAEGESSGLIRNLGFDRYVTRFGPAIGVVVNMVYDPKSAMEKSLNEFVVYRSQADWEKTCIGFLHEHGVEVENMEYMRFSTHFVVATVKRDSLLKIGVLKEMKPTIRECLQSENLELEKLRCFARYLATAVGVPETSPFASAHGVNIFDFSCKGRLKVPCIQLGDLLAENGTSEALTPMVFPVGDTLVNPFWPQGLGVNRGFHSVLDAVFAILLDTVGSREEAIRERIVAHNMNMWYPLVSALIKPGSEWTADPLSRYVVKIPYSMHMNDIQNHRTETSLTPRILKIILNK